MNPSSPSSGASAPPLGSNRRLYDQLRQELDALLHRTEAGSQAEQQAAAQLTERIAGKMHRDRSQLEELARHTYGVFSMGGAGRRRMVLRDITELDGRKPLCTTDDFAEAIRLAGESLEDPVRRPHPPVDVAEFVRTLRRLVREIRDIEEGNRRLTGDGTAAAPYARTDGRPLPASAPLTLGFSGVTPAQLELVAHGCHLVVAKKTPAVS